LTVTKPSAPTYKAGTYYDGLKPLTEQNCDAAVYLQLDVKSSMQLGDASITVVTKQTKAPTVPTAPIHVSYDNWGVVQTFYGPKGNCGGSTWCADTTKGKQGAQLLKDHRITPY